MGSCPVRHVVPGVNADMCGIRKYTAYFEILPTMLEDVWACLEHNFKTDMRLKRELFPGMCKQCFQTVLAYSIMFIFLYTTCPESDPDHFRQTQEMYLV